jgi:hypothetical protein
MSRELDPAAVVARLAELRAAYVPESVQHARARLAEERPSGASESFDRSVRRRLAELRALCELTRHLHART